MGDTNDLKARIEQLEKELLEKKKHLVELKHNLPREEVTNHTFNSWNGSEVSLKDLFGDRDELINTTGACRAGIPPA